MQKRARVQVFGSMLVLLGLCGCGGLNLRAFGGPTLGLDQKVGMQWGLAVSMAHISLPIKAERPSHFIMLHFGGGGDIQPYNGHYYSRLVPELSYMNSTLERLNFRATGRFSVGGAPASPVEPYRYGFGGSLAVTGTLNRRLLPRVNWVWLLGMEGSGDFYISRGPYALPWQEYVAGFSLVLELHREPDLRKPFFQTSMR